VVVLRNTVLIWLVVGGASSSVIWAYAILLSGRPSATLQDSLFFGSVIGMLIGFAYGGLDVVYHIALRFILFLKRLAPLINYATFLDNATYLGFLRRVGSGYMFLHGSLREQFEESGAVTRQSSIVSPGSCATQNSGIANIRT
jgi:hypothetical protein